MNTLLITLLLQFVALPPRAAMENPAAAVEIPRDLKKDYDKAWSRFLAGKEDAKVVKDLEKLLKKGKDFEPALLVVTFIDLYAGKTIEAERKLEQILALNPNSRIALSYLSELSFGRNDYARASNLYTRLLAVDATRTDVEDKRQKAVLLATETLLRDASTAQQENRLSDAEDLYRQALRIAPQEPMIHGELGALLARQKKWDEALTHLRRSAQLRPDEESQKVLAEVLTNLGRAEEARDVLDRLESLGGAGEESGNLEARRKELEDLGRWREDIEYFRLIEDTDSMTREQLAVIIARYFPQIFEFRQTPRILIDTQGSWAGSEIQTVTGLGLIDVYPNHTFKPSFSINRGELAVSLARLARLLGVLSNGAPPVQVSDLTSGNVLYRDIQLALVHRLLTLDEAGNFRTNGPVSGEEAVDAVKQLLHLLGEKAA